MRFSMILRFQAHSIAKSVALSGLHPAASRAGTSVPRGLSSLWRSRDPAWPRRTSHFELRTVRSMATTSTTDHDGRLLQTREEILAVLKGQKIRIPVPDVERLFDGWPRVSNPLRDDERFKEVVKGILQTYTPSPSVARLSGSNLSVILSSWFPFASPARLQELAYFVCWMFILDDEVGMISARLFKEGGDDAEFHRFWAETLRVVRGSCALDGEGVEMESQGGEYISVESFRGIGRLLKERYSVEQRRRFWNEVKKTANSYLIEHNIRKSQAIPDGETYLSYRDGTSCMAQLVSMVEYANESHIPNEIMESPEMKALFAETTRLLWRSNDILSVKKNVGDGFLENIVVIASKPGYRLQDGLDHSIEELEKAIGIMDQAVTTLEAKYVNGKDEVSRELRKFLANVRSMPVGLWIWSFNSGRYRMVEDQWDEDGSIIVTVGDAPL